MSTTPWTIETGSEPIIATAIHAGHDVRDETAPLFEISDADRRREEDPFTDLWVGIAETRIVAHRSRFEFDLNRSRDKTVYLEPADAWGLEVWKQRPDDDILARSLELYDSFYSTLGQLCDDMIEREGHVVVLDLHSYNHRRGGPDVPPEPEIANPEIDLGTASLHRPTWDELVDTFAAALEATTLDGRPLDVRRNVKFGGGNMARWLNGRYGSRCCAIAVEVKKIYMDEWTGELDEDMAALIGSALTSGADAIRDALD